MQVMLRPESGAVKNNVLPRLWPAALSLDGTSGETPEARCEVAKDSGERRLGACPHFAIRNAQCAMTSAPSRSSALQLLSGLREILLERGFELLAAFFVVADGGDGLLLGRH